MLALRNLVPLVTYADSAPILEATRRPHMRNLAPVDTVFLATVAHIRHAHTDYEDLLDQGYDKESARHFVADEIEHILKGWGASRGLDTEPDQVAADPNTQ